MSNLNSENKSLKSKITNLLEDLADVKRRLEQTKKELNTKDQQLIVLKCSENELKQVNQMLMDKLKANNIDC